MVEKQINIRLLHAIENNDPHYANRLIEQGADVNYCSEYGEPLLMITIMKGNVEAVKLLISKKANFNVVYGKNKIGLLHLAIEYKEENDNYRKIIESLIDANCVVNFKDRNGNTPLHVACRTVGYNSDIIPLLIEKGADMDIKNNYGVSPYSMSVDNEMIELNKILSKFRKTDKS